MVLVFCLFGFLLLFACLFGVGFVFGLSLVSFGLVCFLCYTDFSGVDIGVVYDLIHRFWF